MIKVLSHPHTYAHLGVPPEGWDGYHNYLDLMGRYIVQDRFIMSEIAYSEALDRPLLLPYENYVALDAHLILWGGFTVVLTASSELLTDRFAQHGDDQYSLETILDVNDEFCHIVEEGKHHWDLHFHATVDNQLGSLHEITEMYEVRLARQRHLGAEYGEV